MPLPDPHERQALEAVVERAAVDMEFRQNLLTNPQRAVRDAFGVSIPESFKIKFIEKPADIDALIVLPDFLGASGELSDDALEDVSGGAQPPDNTWSKVAVKKRSLGLNPYHP